VIINGDKGEEPAYGVLLNAIRKEGATIQTATAGDVLHQDQNLNLQCVGMNGLLETGTAWSTNDRSLVLRLHYGARSFLLPADIGIASEHRLLQHNDNLRSEVLLAPHHGSRTSTGAEFLAAVNPALVVVSAGQRSQGTLPSPEHLSLWRQKKILALITAEAGTITCRTDGRLLRTSTLGGEGYLFDQSSREFVREK
jgi:competence protein ComEC